MGALKNSKQERFAREYVIDYNGTQAAIRASYSKKSAAQTAVALLKRDDVLERIRELQAEQAKRLALSADRVMYELMDVYRCCRAPEPVMVWDADSHAYVESGEYKFDSKGAINALKLIGEHIGMFTKKVQVSGVDGAIAKLDETLKQLGMSDEQSETYPIA